MVENLERSTAKSKAGGFSTPSAGYTRLMLQIVAHRRSGGREQMTWSQVRRNASETYRRPNGGVRLTRNYVPFYHIPQQVQRARLLHDADEKRRGTFNNSICRSSCHVPLQALCRQGAVRPGARCRDRPAFARSRAQEKTVCGTRARSVAFHRVEGRVCDPRSRALCGS